MEAFLQELEAHGFTLGVREYVQVAALLEASAKREDDPEVLKYKLAAYLAKDSEQQKKVYHYFDRYLEKQSIQPAFAEPKDPVSFSWKDWWRRNGLALSLGVLSLGIMMAAAYGYMSTHLPGVSISHEISEINPISGEVSVSASFEVKDFAPIIKDEAKAVYWNWGDGTTPDTLEPGQSANHIYKQVSKSYNLDLIVETSRGRKADSRIRIAFDPLCERKIASNRGDGRMVNQYRLQAYASTRGAQLSNLLISDLEKLDSSMSFTWDLGDGIERKGKEIDYIYTDTGIYQILLTTRLENGSNHGSCVSVDSLRVEIPRERELTIIQTSEIATRIPQIGDLKESIAYDLYMLLALISLGFYGLYEYLIWRKRKMVLDSQADKLPPLRQKFELDPPELNLYGNEYFSRVSTKMRARRLSGIRDLDLKTTLKESIRAGGEYPHFQYKTRLQASQYLVLIDERNAKDHQARFYEYMARELVHRDITVAYYFYDYDPSLCWKRREEASSQIPLNQLATTFGGYRLLLIGDGQGVLDPYTGKLQAFTYLFQEFPERALLSTRPSELWGREEETLSSLFSFLPATELGWEELIPQWQQSEFLSPADWKMKAFEMAPPKEGSEFLVEELRHYLGEFRFQWLCACAVYPVLYYELTLKLGEIIAGNEVSLESLGHLFRLEWFQKGSIPDEIRLKLIPELEPEYARQTRVLLMEILEENPAPEHSLADQDQKMSMAIYSYLNSARNTEDKERLKESLEDMDPQDLEDVVTVKYLSEIEHNPLLIPLHSSLYKGGIGLLGTKWQGRLAILLALMFLTFLGISFNKLGSIFQNDGEYQETELELSTREDSARWYHYHASLLSENREYAEADSLMQLAIRTDILETSHVDSFMYDFWVHRYNWSTEEYYKDDILLAETLLNYAPDDRDEIIGDSYQVFFDLDDKFFSKLPEDSTYKAPYFVDYMMGLIDLQKGKVLEEDYQTYQNQLQGVEILNTFDTAFYDGSQDNVFTRESPIAKDQLVEHLQVSSVPVNNPDLVELMGKLGQQLYYYQLIIKTGKLDGAQTDEKNITLTIVGSDAAVIARLDSTERGNKQFESGRVDRWTISSKQNLGQIRELTLNLGDEGKTGLDDWLIGTIKFRDVENGETYEFTANTWIGNYRNREQELRLVPGEEIVSNIETTPAEKEIRSNPSIFKSQIIGRILGPDRKPLAGLRVKAKRSNQTSQTKANGEFTLFMTANPFVNRAGDWELLIENPIGTKIGDKFYKSGSLSYTMRVKAKIVGTTRIQIELKESDFRGPPVLQNDNEKGSFIQEQSSSPNYIKPVMVEVKGGSYYMGREGKNRGNQVEVSSFLLGKYEVTFEEFDLFIRGTRRNPPVDMGWGRGKRPVINVSWEDAIAYCNWLSQQEGLPPVYEAYARETNKGQETAYRMNPKANGYRLPTEAEWEFAARGGRLSRDVQYAGSNTAYSVAWYEDNSKNQTHPAGQLAPNELKLYDMSGNVWEWCWDWYEEDYQSKNPRDPLGPGNGRFRVMRGGSYELGEQNLRVTTRNARSPVDKHFSTGFRVARR